MCIRDRFWGVQRLLNARFGHTLQAIRENEPRMIAIGFPVYRYKLVAFTIAGALAGLAGVLLVNLNSFASPSMLQWHQSGVLMMMVILGGVGHLYGPVIGAVVFLLLELSLIHIWMCIRDRFIGSPPLAFTFGLGGLVLFPMSVGASTVLLEKASPRDLLDGVKQYGATVLFTAPTSYRVLAADAAVLRETKLRKCVSAGEALPGATRLLWRCLLYTSRCV